MLVVACCLFSVQSFCFLHCFGFIGTDSVSCLCLSLIIIIIIIIIISMIIIIWVNVQIHFSQCSWCVGRIANSLASVSDRSARMRTRKKNGVRNDGQSCGDSSRKRKRGKLNDWACRVCGETSASDTMSLSA